MCRHGACGTPTRIDKYGTSGDTRLLTGSDMASTNGTKATPALSGDILGDWREEVIWRTSSSSALRIYLSTSTPSRRLYDAQYRVALAWQNTAYNQPPHPSYFIGDGMAPPHSPSSTSAKRLARGGPDRLTPRRRFLAAGGWFFSTKSTKSESNYRTKRQAALGHQPAPKNHGAKLTSPSPLAPSL